MDTTKTVYAYRLQLWDQVKVGAIQVNTLNIPHSNATYGARSSFPSSMPTLPLLAGVSPGTTPLNVTSSTPIANPGKYGAVNVGNAATWKLRSGVYHLASLHIENDAHVEVLGPVQIRIAGRFDALDRTKIIPAAGVSITAGDLRIEVSGQNGASGSLWDSPKAAQFGTDAQVSGVMLVRNGTLQFAARALLKGAYLARDIYIDTDGTINFQSGVGPSPCLQSCDDGLLCTLDTCNNGTCAHTNAPVGTSCSDSNACNGIETCNSNGQCLPGTPPPPCQAVDQCHSAGVCDPTTGQCSNPVKADGTSCSDDNACTGNDACTSGICRGRPYSCDDGLGCTSDSCNGDGTCTHDLVPGTCRMGAQCYAPNDRNPDNLCEQCTPETSQVAWSPTPAGASCDDQNTCTKADHCDGARACVGTAYTCDDGLTCTVDMCVGDGSCNSQPLPGSCAIDGACYQLGDISPTNPCLSCQPGAGKAWSNKTDGTVCSDGNDKTGDDACTMGQCQGTQTCAPIADVSAGGDHTCAVRTDGTLWCWGRNESGQLGTGTQDERRSPTRIGDTTWHWEMVSAGTAHTCAIRLDTTLWCWGDNTYGQLGDGTTDMKTSPVKVDGTGWTEVRAGKGTTCGVTAAGALRCWGDNAAGNLGNGTQDSSVVPVEVVGSNWTAVAVGPDHTCGVQTDNTLWCWGDNASGQVGDGTTAAKLTPVQVSGGDWASVVAGTSEGDAFTCGMRLDGSLWCWGDNASGQLGLGTQANANMPVRVGAQIWLSVAAAGGRASGVQETRSVWAWGANQAGQLGDGTQTQRLSPVRILGNDYEHATAGRAHGCGQRMQGSLWCWGDNANGAVGPEADEMSLAPVQVVGDLCNTVPICGNGIAEPGEECDDGNVRDGDRCTWDCKINKCFDVHCDAPDQCRQPGICDPADGVCKFQPKVDGVACDDNNACTQTDTCQAGECVGGSEKECQASDGCHTVGTCDPSNGVCSDPIIDKMGCSIKLLEAAVAKMGDGTYIGIFGYDSGARSPFHPTENTVTPPLTESPYPPAYLLPGKHVGAFLPRMTEGQTITWKVDSEVKSVTANAATALTPRPNGSGTQVDVGGTTVDITPDLSSYLTKPDDPATEIEPLFPNRTDFQARLAGQLSVSPTGAAVYTMPIKIPPGRAGMAPNLNLVYDSQSGYGIAGFGWNMTGLSVIHRCAKTLASDGYSQPIKMDATSVANESGDGVCLDGKRLHYRSDTGKFKAEMEDFTDITFVSENDTFVVKTKAGETRTYGLTKVQFPVENADGVVEGGSKVTAIWALDRVQDLWGNYYDLGYNENGVGTVAESGLLVTSINYSGHVELRNQTPGDFILRFEYEPRSESGDDGDWPDTGWTRFRDSTLPNNKRLKTIRIERSSEGGELAHYSLLYRYPVGSRRSTEGPRSRLQGIKYCVDTQCALAAFGWDTETGDPSTVQWTDDQDSYHLPVDRMGPGTQLIDLNGDGLVDLVQAVRGYGQSHVWQNTGAGWVPRDEWKLPDYVSLGEPKVALTDDWESQAWIQMRCWDTTETGRVRVPGWEYGFRNSICDNPDPCPPYDDECLNAYLKKNVDLDKDDLQDLVVSGTVFADIDGDGLPDLITDRLPYSNGRKPTSARPKVYFNRTRDKDAPNKWEPQEGLSGENLNQVLKAVLPDQFNQLNLTPLGTELENDRYSLTDIDGDGRAELVFVDDSARTLCHTSCCGHPTYVFRANLQSGQWEYDPGPGIGWAFLSESTGHFLFADVNRDGLPDVVDTEGYLLAVNTGLLGKGLEGTMWSGRRVQDPQETWKYYCQAMSMPIGARKFVLATGDVDGDGIHDQVVMRWKATEEEGMVIADPPGGQTYDKATKFYMATGTGWNGAQADDFWGSVLRFTGDNHPEDSRLLTAGRYRFQFADLNADGRADAIVNYPWGGLFLLNTGEKFVDVEGHSSYWDFDKLNNPNVVAQQRPVPTTLDPFTIKAAEPFDTFLDLNGDGVPDRIQLLRKTGDTGVFKGAWRNKFQKPVIRAFSNGYAQDTKVEYVGINTQEGRSGTNPVYEDTNEQRDGTKFMAAPIVVVKSVVADDGIGTKRTTSYRYKNLRASSIGKGPAGFREVTALDEASEIGTTTTYAQAYPYIGMPTKVLRTDRNEKKITLTETKYCDHRKLGDKMICSPEGTWLGKAGESGVFVHPLNVTDTTFLRDTGKEDSEAQRTIETYTEYVFDDHGNSTSTTVTTTSSTEKYLKSVTNKYGDANSETAIHGKPLSTTVTSQRLIPPEDEDGTPTKAKEHKTEFEYTPELAVSKKLVERNSGFGTEVHTAYDYDIYGNIEITTVCASDFENCAAGLPNPNGDPQNPQHPPFRSSYVSYKTDELTFTPGPSAPRRTLAYSDGLYPVKATNALGHVQYTAYDDFLGLVVQTTGPNGIHTCFEYDKLGFKTAEVARCNASHTGELRTTFTRHSVQGGTLTETKPPVGPPSVVRLDTLGRTVEAVSYDFEGKLVHVDTEYDGLGRVWRVSKPHPSSVTGDQRSLTSSHYDWLGRIDTVTENLGYLDGGRSRTSTTVTTSYREMTVTTEQTVRGEKRSRTEWKNLLGKVAMIEDALGHPISYSYDPDGNLTDTFDPAGNKVHIEYDLVGRKKLTTDPDLGKWTYDYNGFGDLIQQTDSKNQTTGLATKMTYDQLGRMVSKTDPTGKTTEWIYDLGQAGIGKLSASISAPDEKLAGACAVPGRPAGTTDRAVRAMSYNELGDLAEVQECIRGDLFVTSYGYDSYGRQTTVTYPQVNGTRATVESVFSSMGFLHYLADGNDANHAPYWVVKKMNPAGQVIQEQTRNGVEVVSNRNDSGWMLGTTAVAVPRNGDMLQDLQFTFDEVGSLRTRSRGPSQYFPALNETFTYDKLDRLHTSEVDMPSTSGSAFGESETYDYDSLGNITAKGGKLYTYTGCGAGPHAVCTVGGGPAYAYDANGNMIKGNGRTVTYNAANKSVHIERDSSGAMVDFAYGAEGQRVFQEVGNKNGGEPSRTVYVGLGATGKSVYERTTTGNKVEHVQFLYAGGVHGGNAIALRVTKDAATTASMKFNMFDHLGSITGMTDDYGRIVGPAFDPSHSTVFWYDAWGASRNPDGSRTSTPISMQAGHRGYTGHESIPDVGLVNMNGRVYDPELGRFLTGDPNVQFVANLQSYNRYSYVLNNPLRYTDPTGYWSFGGMLAGVMSGPGWLTTLGTLIACSSTGGAGCVGTLVWSAVVTSTVMAASGASFGQIATTMGVQYGAGAVGGGVSGSLIGDAGGGLGMTALGGAISGAVAVAIAKPILTGNFNNLGENMLQAAVVGAATAGVAWAARGGNPVSVASAEQQGGGPEGRQFRLRSGTAELVDPIAEPEPGTVGDSDPIADPRIKRVLRDAYSDSKPGNGDFYDPARKEHGGYIIRRPPGLARWLFGEYRVQEWKPVGIDYIYADPVPEGEDVVCSYHTHPNNGADYRHSASQPDWTEWGHGTTPHYIVSGSGIYQIGRDSQTFLGPFSIIAN